MVLIPNPRETHLKLQHTTNKLVAVPQTTIAWEEKSPFFIKFCKSWGRSSRYVSVIKCGENTTTKDATEPHNQQSQTKEGANGNSQPKFKLASGTKHNSSDHKLVPLYFEPAVTSKLPEPVTFMGQAKGSPRSQLVCDYNSPLNEDKSKVFSFNECEPDSKSKVLPDDAEYESNSSPPYESRITSDSSLLSQEEDPSYAESDTVTDQEETYYDSEIEDAIFELVGDEYDFPLHI